jgi:hypothetical protein
LQCHIQPHTISVRQPDQWGMAARQKWLFSPSPIILNAPIQQTHVMAGEQEERRNERSQQN